MTYNNAKLFFGVTRRLVIQVIIVALIVGVFCVLIKGIHMMTIIMASHVIQSSKNYEGFLN